ncbi:hypothetical protein Ae505Ps2_3140 [Pseudonocardia sp. Ae505_Ps2]|nr:hypothetical protein Ae505Ps2_3140 [Pseudonocardia sp. Ae505_Ps2]
MVNSTDPVTGSTVAATGSASQGVGDPDHRRPAWWETRSQASGQVSRGVDGPLWSMV